MNFTRYSATKITEEQISDMEDTIKDLYGFSQMSFRRLNELKREYLTAIINFMDKDGSFRLVDTDQIESDAQVWYCCYPSYYCTGTLMKVLLQNKGFFAGKEKDILPKALEYCCIRSLRGQGYADLTKQIEIMDFFISCGLSEFIEKYPDLCPKFTKMIEQIVENYLKCIREKKFVFYFGENHEQDFKRIVIAMGM